MVVLDCIYCCCVCEVCFFDALKSPEDDEAVRGEEGRLTYCRGILRFVIVPDKERIALRVGP